MNKPACLETQINSDDNALPLAGILFGFAGAVLYTLANVFLRRLSTEVDPFLVAGTKAACTATVGWIALWLTAIRPALAAQDNSKRVFPVRQGLIWLVLAAIQAQLFGGVLVQVAFGTLGIALVVPIYIGSLVASTAVLGSWLLKEPVSRMLAIALTVIIVSVFLLSTGAGAAHENMQKIETSVVSGVSFWIGLLCALAVGISYAVLGITIRGSLKKFQMAGFAPVVVVATTGTLLLGTIAISRGAVGALQTMDPTWIGMMLLAGLSNSIAFLCLVTALKLLPAVYVNAINASQVAMAALFGLMLFGEPVTTALLLGLVVMMVGFGLLMKKGDGQT